MAEAEKPELSKKQALAEYLTANPEAPAKKVVRAMKKQGFDITDSVVYNAKWEMKKDKEAAAKKAPAKRTAKKAEPKLAEVEAAKPEPAPTPAPSSRTQAVKDYLAQNREAAPKDVAAALQTQGIDVSPSYVSGIKFQMNKKKGGRKKRAKAAPAPEAAATPAVPKDAVSLSLLTKAKKLAAQLGGIKEAKAAIDALAQIMD